MINPPTDRLHKFIAITGIALIIFSITIPIDKYNEAELARIEANENLNKSKFAYARFAEIVREETSLFSTYFDKNSKLKEGVDVEKFRNAAKDFFARAPEVRKLEREMNDSLIQSEKHLELMEHFVHIRNIWFLIGISASLLGLGLAYVGFKQWLKQPKSIR